MTPEWRSTIYREWLIESEVEVAALVNGQEPKDRKYKRAVLTAGSFEERDGEAVLVSPIVFPTAAQDWGRVSALRVFSRDTHLFDAPIPKPRLIEADDILQVEADGIAFQLNAEEA